MKTIRRMGVVSALMASYLGAATLCLGAQESTTKDSEAPSTKRTYDPARRVPPYFGQLGLSPDQKESIYKIRGKHQAQIDALQKQITDTQKAMLAECETVLTDTQKQLLTDRRRAAAEGKKKEYISKTTKDQGKASN